MIEIRYEERAPNQPPALSRILVWGQLLRLDYGQDDADFVLYDHPARRIWHVSREARQMTGIAVAPARYHWPADWRLSQEQYQSGPDVITRVQLNGQLCAEFKSAPMLAEPADLMRRFRKGVAGKQADAWGRTANTSRQPCALALEVREAGIEYRHGMPLAVRYWDGRVRLYQRHDTLPVRRELFELPEDYSRVVAPPQGKGKARQPTASQRR